MTTDTAPTKRRNTGHRVADIVLTGASIGGVICIVLVVLALVFHITLIMFKTGSMTPTIPAGSLAVVREIPASEIKVDDIVTVDRSPALPVTHRVVSVDLAGGDARSIVLRGDANPANDASPYVVTHVRIVLWSVPQLAHVVQAMSNPFVIGAITLGTTALVTWAFWPRGASPAGRRRAGSGRHSVAAGVMILGAVSAAQLLGPVAPARAAETEEVVSGNVLTLTSIGDRQQMAHLLPGVVVPWQIGVAANPPDPGNVILSLTAQGTLAQSPSGLNITVKSCTTRWTGGTCAGGGTTLLGPGPAASLIPGSVVLLTMPSDEERWLVVEGSLPTGAGTLPAGSATLGIVANGLGETVSVGDPLATTGIDLFPPLLTAIASIAFGLLLAFGAAVLRRRREVVVAS